MATSNKKALNAGAWYVFSNFLIKGINILITPIITRLITPAEFGIFNTYRAMLGIMTVIVTLNVLASVQIARYDYLDDDEYNRYISAILSLSVLGVIIGYIAYKIIRLFTGPLLDMPDYLMDFMFLNILFTEGFQIWQSKNRAEMRYKIFVFLAILVAIVSPILSVSLVSLQETNKYIGYILGTQLPLMLLGLYVFFYFFKNYRTFVHKEHWHYALSISLPLIPHALSNNLLAQADQVLINTYRGANEVGLYSLAYSYSAVLLTIWNSLNQAWAPWFYAKMTDQAYGEIKRFVKPYTVLFSTFFLAMIAIGPEALKIFGPPEYQDGVWVIAPVLLGLYFQFAYSLYVNIEIYLKRTKYISFGTMGAALLNVLLNILLIPSFGFIGAAYTTLLGYIFLFLVHFYTANYFMGKDVIGNKFIGRWSIFMVAITGGFIGLTNYIVIRYLFALVIIAIMLVRYKTSLQKIIDLVFDKLRKKRGH